MPTLMLMSLRSSPVVPQAASGLASRCGWPGFRGPGPELRARARELPDAYLVALVGDMVTEEALPSYMNMLNLLDGTKVGDARA